MRTGAAHNEDIIRRDTGLPSLRLLLEPGSLADLLRDQIPDASVRSANVGYIRYKPGVNCLAKCTVDLGDRVVEAYAKIYGADAPVKLRKDRQRPTTNGALGPGRVFEDRHAMVLNLFPNDAKLPSLDRLVNPETRGRLLARVLGLTAPPQISRLETLAYKPERRYVARVDMPAVGPLTLKLYSSSRFDSSLLAAGPSPDQVSHPTRIGKSRKHRIQAFSWIPGINLREVTVDEGASTTPAKLAGSALAAFHQRCTVQSSTADHGTRLAALSDQLVFLLPGFAQRAHRLTGRLSTWLADQRGCDTVIHGDFYDKQVLVHRGVAHLLDLDDRRIGHSHYDLGLFVAHLIRHAIAGRVSEGRAGRLAEALLCGYEDAGGSVGRADLDGYTALGLFQLIHHPFRDQDPDWPRQMDEMLGRIERLVQSAAAKPQIARSS